MKKLTLSLLARLDHLLGHRFAALCYFVNYLEERWEDTGLYVDYTYWCEKERGDL